MMRSPLATAPWSTVICCAAVPPFDQPLNVYLRPLLSVSAEAAETLCVEPSAQVNSGGYGQLLRPSMVSGRLLGLVEKYAAAPGRKLAVGMSIVARLLSVL